MQNLTNTLEVRKARERVRYQTTGKPLTEQSHKKDCDIRFIMKKAEKTGMLTHVNNNQASYMDLASRPEFMEAQIVLAEAKSVFETIPAKVREKFKNDPAEFLEFIQNEENRETITELGFSTDHLPPLPEAPAEPIAVTVTNPTAE